MSMRDFVEGECGQNPVLKVASHLTSDLGQSSSRHLNINSVRHDGFHAPPNSFQMESLLKEIHAFGNHSNAGPVQAPSISELATHPEWAEEFLMKREEFVRDSLNEQENWVRDYISKDPEFDTIWDPDNYSVMHQPHIHAIHHSMAHGEQISARDLLDDSRWSAEYAGVDTQNLDKTEIMKTAEEFLKSVSDPKIKATEFMSFVEKLSTGDIAPDGQRADTKSKQWASEYSNEVQAEMAALSAQGASWVEDYVSAEDGTFPEGRTKEEYWEKLSNEWEKMAQEDSITHPWLSEATASKVNEPYHFSEENAFKETENPLEEGKRKLLAGDISTAVLLFEAAVLQEPENTESWMYLGTTQSLNEQDLLSISALNKVLQIEPNNLTALMSLATSLTNESFHLQACNVLKRWLKYNDKYSQMVNEELSDTLTQTTSLLPAEELLKVQEWFMQAARINPSNGVDPDVQCGLGILFNLGADYEKAADCFQSALNVNPDNPMLWNRLGATLANGGKSSEAISVYRRALELSPGYVRTRYNLGIACVNLAAYREAADHFLTALNMQASAKSPSSVNLKRSPMSDCIWASLRTSLHLSDMSNLSRLIDSRDLDGINRALGFAGV